MNVSELENRMKGFLETDYSAYFFIEDGLAFWKHCGFNETCIAMRYKG